MGRQFRILIVIPKVNQTDLAVFLDDMCMYQHTLTHTRTFTKESDTKEEVFARGQEVMTHLLGVGINMSKFDAVTSIGGLLKPVEGGIYYVNEQMITHLHHHYNGRHISNLGGLIANAIAKHLHIKALIVDPPVVNELNELATFTGIPSIERISIFHALNQKAVARFVAEEVHHSYENLNLIVCHIGFGTTIGAHQKGKVIDVNNGLHGDGPFSIERAGTIPLNSLLNLCYSEKYKKEQLQHKLSFESGLKAHLNIQDTEDVFEALQHNSDQHEKVIKAMTYQIAKEIGQMAVVLKGEVDAIVLTGPLATIEMIQKGLIDRTSWIADVYTYPGEYHFQALHESTLRVLRKEEKAKHYV